MATDWQGRCGALIGLILPLRGFAPGEFENMTESQWAALLVEARAAAQTDPRLELAAQALRERGAAAEAARAKLTPQELAVLRQVGV